MNNKVYIYHQNNTRVSRFCQNFALVHVTLDTEGGENMRKNKLKYRINFNSIYNGTINFLEELVFLVSFVVLIILIFIKQSFYANVAGYELIFHTGMCCIN